jgi:hypothetical protein
VVVGGGVGGVAATLSALHRGLNVILTEETDWLGGQFTAQAVPPDEHPWIEQFGCTATYRRLRDEIRAYYHRWYPLSRAARSSRWLNPGVGAVSRLCHEPQVALAVIEALLAPYRSTGVLTVLLNHRPVAAEADGDRVIWVQVADDRGSSRVNLQASFFLDATEAGDLLPLTGTEYVTGSESSRQTGEPHAPADAQPGNVQAFSVCFAMDHVAGADFTIDKPSSYSYWMDFRPQHWPGSLLGLSAPDPRTLAPRTRTFLPNPVARPIVADQSVDPGDDDLWTFRRILARETFRDGFLTSDITVVNWPMIDYWGGSIVDVDDATRAKEIDAARQLSVSFLYWLQTEAPRPDGGTGWPGLRLRPDVTGTPDGLAKTPYVRESRRVKALYTIVEQDLALDVRGDAGAVTYEDSVGVGSYRIDLHPSTMGDTYIDVASAPFQIPLRALIPLRVRNLLPAAKNIGTTHITNGCYRMHPTEWNIGEVAGALAAHCALTGREPAEVASRESLFERFRDELVGQGVEVRWPHVAGY